MMRFTAFVLIFVLLCSGLSDASLCQPYSTFKVDCNNCLCSADGRHYSCTDKMCPPAIDNEKYDVKLTKDGYRLLVPKNDIMEDNSESFLEDKPRYPRVPNGYPYINDEIPPSKEDTHTGFDDIDDINEEIDENMSEKDDRNEVDDWEYNLIRK